MCFCTLLTLVRALLHQGQRKILCEQRIGARRFIALPLLAAPSWPNAEDALPGDLHLGVEILS